MSWLRALATPAMLATAVVALAVGAAVGGTVAGARVAAEAAPHREASAPRPPGRGGPPVHSIIGRVADVDGELVYLLPPDGLPTPVHVLPRTIIRRAGQRVAMDAIQPGDGVLAVGRLDDAGVLQARGLLVRPAPAPRPPREGGPERPPKPSPPEGAPERPARPSPPDAAPARPPKPPPPDGGPPRPPKPPPPDGAPLPAPKPPLAAPPDGPNGPRPPDAAPIPRRPAPAQPSAPEPPSAPAPIEPDGGS